MRLPDLAETLKLVAKKGADAFYKGPIAKKISEEELGKYFPNTPTLGAVVKVTGVMTEEQFFSSMEGSFKHKFANKPQVIEPNVRALRRGYEEVK